MQQGGFKKMIKLRLIPLKMLGQKEIIYVFVWALGMSMMFHQATLAQDPVFNKFSEEEGLPSNDVYDVLVDADGLMWFATDNGVSRYDGNKFLNFDVADGLPANSVLKLYEDLYGRIWFLAYNGMLSYYDQGKLIAYQFNDSIGKYIHDNYLNNILVDSGGGVRISPQKGGQIYIDKYGNFQTQDYLVRHGLDSCFLSFEDLGADYFLTILSQEPSSCERNGILFFKDSTYYLKASFTPREFQRNYLELGRNTYLVSYRNRVYYIKDHKLITHKEFDEEVLTIFRDDQERIWVSVKYDNGIYMYENALFMNGIHYLEGYTITSITQDYEGDYWLGTEGHGVYFSPSFDFNLYTLPWDDRYLNVMALEISGNRIWFTSRDKHLYSGFLSKGKISKIRQVDIGEPFDWIKHICIDSEGYLWLSSTRYVRYDPAGFPRPVDSVFNSAFLGQGIGDTMIVANKKLAIYKHDKLLSLVESESSRRVYSAFQDEDHTIWLGTLYGLYIYSDGEWCNKGNISPFLKERISCIDKLKDMLVVGTAAHGLLFLKGDSVAFHFTEENGLIGNKVKSLYIQNDTILWIGTKSGLNRIAFNFNDETYEIESYGQSDGLPSSEINSILMHEGYIWLATGTGLVSFDPRNLKPHITPPMIQITSVQINGRDTVLLDYYSLAHDQNDIRISFNGISYRADEDLRYRYRLSNYNNEIIQTKNQWANFPNLPPGEYTFFVNVGNIHGIWNDPPKVFSSGSISISQIPSGFCFCSS